MTKKTLLSMQSVKSLMEANGHPNVLNENRFADMSRDM